MLKTRQISFVLGAKSLLGQQENAPWQTNGPTLETGVAAACFSGTYEMVHMWIHLSVELLSILLNFKDTQLLPLS